MMRAIVDQGEGHEHVKFMPKAGEMVKNPSWCFVKKGQSQDGVLERYQPDDKVIAEKYPSYNDSGDQEQDSSHAYAREQFGEETHFDRFDQIRKDLDKITTFVDWHAQGKSWSEVDLVTDVSLLPATRAKAAALHIPTPDEVAQAMNRLKGKRGQDGDNFDDFSRGAVGGLYGVVQSLKEFWRDQNFDDSARKYALPLGAMRAVGDRIAIIWAVYGETPDLSMGIGNPDDLSKLHNACQGLSFDNPGNSCGAMEAYHTCKNANSCRTQGACGVVAKDCNHRVEDPMAKACDYHIDAFSQECTKGDLGENYSAPADNQCKTLGGCSVPISASQLFRKDANLRKMNLYRFDYENIDSSKEGYVSHKLDEALPFRGGETIYDKAWAAYEKVMEEKKRKHGDKPEANDMRVALIPN